MPVVEIRMPDEEREGTEAAVGRWLKRAGDPVLESEPLVEIDTDKVTVEVAAPAKGVLGRIERASGDAVHPGELLGTIETGESAETAESAVGEVESGGPPSSERLDEGARSGHGSVSGGRVGEAATSFSPVVRRLLRELGLDPEQVAKVSRGGRLTPEDIRAHLAGEGGQAASTGPAAADATGGLGETDGTAGRLVPHTPMRRSIARHMTQSVQTAPHVTSVFEADLDHVLRDRERRKQTGEDPVPSVTAYLIRAALRAIAEVPEVNSKWREAHLEVFDQVNFGVGTALDSGGLVVPVIRDAQTMSFDTLAERLRELTRKARSGRLTRDDLEGGTFTLSNHGVSGSLLAAPIILPHGQAAILGAGKLQKRVVVCETGGRELFRVRPMMYVTLTVDHRVLDGQQTNRFLTTFVAALEEPVPLPG